MPRSVSHETIIHSIIPADRIMARFIKKPPPGEDHEEAIYIRVHAWAHCRDSHCVEQHLVMGLVAGSNAFSLASVLEYELDPAHKGWFFDGYHEEREVVKVSDQHLPLPRPL